MWIANKSNVNKSYFINCNPCNPALYLQNIPFVKNNQFNKYQVIINLINTKDKLWIVN